VPKNKPTLWIICAVLAVLSGFLQFSEYNDNFFDHLLFDLTLAQNSWLTSAADQNVEYGVAVISFDEKSYNSENLNSYGLVGLAPKLAELIQGLGSDVEGIGFDYVFSYPDDFFRDGYEKTLLEAIGKHRKKIVLGRMEEIDLHYRFYAALEGDGGVGAIDVKPDSDNVVRSVLTEIPATLKDSHKQTSLKTLSGLLLELTRGATGILSIPQRILLAPRRSLEWIPTYSFIDVLNCYENKYKKVLEDTFSRKIVLIGTTIKGQDRKRTSDRFMSRPAIQILQDKPEGATQAGRDVAQVCQLKHQGVSNPKSATVPGVYLHAAAVDAVLRKQVATEIPRYWQIVLAFVATFAAAWAGFRLTPLLGLLVTVAGISGLHLVASIMLVKLYWMPTALIDITMLLSVSICYAYSYVFVDVQKRKTQRYFTSFLHPKLVQEYADTGKQPELEEKEITIMFADLTEFTKMSEEVSTKVLVTLTNEYLELITKEIISTGGYVDKFIGDAAMGIWGAPVDDRFHALNAVRSGMEMAKRINKKEAMARNVGKPGFGVKVGINTGTAIVGNIGAGGRLNYTAVGKPVNIASRLENVPAMYGCAVILSGETASAVSSVLLLNEIDCITVSGSKTPFSIYQPLCDHKEAGHVEKLYCEKYAEAFRCYREGDFLNAAALWETLHAEVSKISDRISDFQPAKVMADKAKKRLQSVAQSDET